VANITGLTRRRALALVLPLIIAVAALSTYLFLSHREAPSGGSLTQPESKDTEKSGFADPYAVARERMVTTQIENPPPSRTPVKDPLVLAAMRAVPRHEFVPADQLPNAYEDRPLPIGYGQTISQPYIVAIMTEALELKGNTSRALEIGTGSGYQAAVLAKICKEVYSIEIIKPLADRSASTLKRLGFTNIEIRNGDGYFGWEEEAPFDAIIVTCAASHIPSYLVEQLADGGKLILPLGSPYTWQTLTLVEKHGDKLNVRYLFPVAFVPMTGQIEKAGPEEPT